MKPKQTHREIAKKLLERIGGEPKVVIYDDASGGNRVAIGEYGKKNCRVYSTIGLFEKKSGIPSGSFEFALAGPQEWLPLTVVTTLIWLKRRTIREWPLVCEDVIRPNAGSTYRHIAYIPSDFELTLSTGKRVRWLIGVPVTDKDISITESDVKKRCRKVFPDLFFGV